MAINWDNYLPYVTPKFARIRDRRLGCMKYTFQILIFVYVVLYNIVYNCKHLKVEPVTGTTRVTVQAPTIEDCDTLNPNCQNDFEAASTLAYCSEFKEADGTDANDTEGKYDARVSRQIMDNRHCIFMDGASFSNKDAAPGTIFVPTRFDIAKQISGCDPQPPDFTCDQRWKYARPDQPWRKQFIDDIEDYKITIDHSYQTQDLTLAGVAGDHTGHVEIPCDPEGDLKACMMHPQFAPVPRDGLPRLEALPSVRGGARGDSISIRDLLEMIRPQHKDYLAWKTHEERRRTVRSDGAVIALRIQYTNKQLLDYMGKAPIKYMLTATLLPLKENKQMWSDDNSLEPMRTIYNAHGLTIIAGISGDLHVFSVTQLLTVLSSSLVLIATAITLVDALLMYLLPEKDRYTLIKVQKTHDYDESDKKETTIGDILNKSNEKPPLGPELLGVLCKIDQRLNRIDGMDATFTDTSEDVQGRSKFLYGLEKKAEGKKKSSCTLL